MAPAPETKERIKDTALRLFVDKGVAETSIRDIAQTAGLSQGAMYNHYASKDELVWDLFNTSFSGIGLRLREIAEANKDLEGQLRAMVRYVFELFERDWAVVAYVFFTRHELLRKASCTEILFPYTVFRRVVDEAVKRKEIPQQDPDVSTALLVGAILQVADAKALGRLKHKLTDLTDRVVSAGLRLLREPE